MSGADSPREWEIAQKVYKFKNRHVRAVEENYTVELFSFGFTQENFLLPLTYFVK